MPASSIDLRFTREDSTYGTGSKLEVPGSETNGIVALSIPSPGGTVQYSTPAPTRGGSQGLSGTTTIQNVAPDGTGWFLEDTSVLSGKRTYNDAATTATIDFESFSGAVDANLYMRFFKYQISTGTYTYIGVIYDLTTSFQQSRNAVCSATLPNIGTFGPDVILYVDFVWYFPDGTSTARTVNLRTGNGISVLSLRVIPQSDLAPPNDPFAGAVALNPRQFDSKSASNVYASYEDGEPLWAQYSGGGGFLPNNIDGPGSLWWKWTCPTGGVASVTFDTIGSFSHVFSNLRINTRLRVWTADVASPTFAQLTLVAENDNQASYSDNGAFEDNPPMSPDKYSKVLLMNPEVGRTYWLQVMTCSFNGDTDPPSSTGNIFCRSTPAYRGAWIQRPNLILDNDDLLTTLDDTAYSGGGLVNNAGVGFHQTNQFHGAWEIWQFAPYPNPAPDPRAYEQATLVSNCGDQSRGENANQRDVTWDPDDQDGDGDPTILPFVYRCCGRIGPVFDMGSQSQATDGSLPTGAGSSGSATASGGFASISPSFPGLCNWSTYWGFRIFHPRYACHQAAHWTYLGKLPGSADVSGLPAGAQGVVYSKTAADLVRFRIRPGTGGASAHPSNGLFGQSIVGEWWEIPNLWPNPPTWGLWRNGAGQWVCRTNTSPGTYPSALPGDMRTMGGRHIGDVTYIGGAQSSRTTNWTVLLENEEQAADATYTPSDVWMFGFAVDFILAHVTMGDQIATAQAGTSSWSFTRHISGHDIEFELELKLPCYAILYPAPSYSMGTVDGSNFFESDCSTTTGWTSATPASIDSGRFRFVTSPSSAYLDLGGSASPSVMAEFDFEPASLSGIGGGEFVSFYGDGGTVRHVYGNLANTSGTVTWQVGAASVLTSTGLVTTGEHRYHVQVIVSDTDGSIIVWKDGAVHSQVHGVDTKNGGTSAFVDRVFFGAHGNTTYLDDVVIGPTVPLNDECPGLELPPNLIEPPLRMIQRDDDNGLNTDGSQTPRLLGTGGVQRASSQQRSRYPRLQTRNEKGYR